MAHQKNNTEVECAWCFEMIPLRKLAQHREKDCEGRMVECRHPGCPARFRAWERGEHEQHFCEFIKAKQQALSAHRQQAAVLKEERVAQKQQQQEAAQAEARASREKAEAFYKEVEYNRKKRAVVKEEKAEEAKVRQREEQEAKLAEVRRQQEKRDYMLGAAKAKLVEVECPQCSQMVVKKDLPKHLKFLCPYGTRTCELCNTKVRKMNWEMHCRGKRPPCFECGRCPCAEPCIYQSKRKIQTVRGDFGPVPHKATQKLTQLALQLQQRPKMREQILRTFIEAEEEVCRLEVVEEVIHASTGGFVVDWTEFLLQLLQLSKDMMVCEQAGRVGRVVVEDIAICYECWDDDKLAPLTGKDQYVRREVCPQVFLTQNMLEHRNETAAVLGWECQHDGCGETFKTKTARKVHMEQDCTLRLVDCMCTGCPARFPLKDRAAHESECTFYAAVQRKAAKGVASRQLVECSLGCGASMEIRRREQHETKECVHRCVPCERGCGCLVQLLDMKRHIADDCHAPSEVARRAMIAKARRKYLESSKSHADPMVLFFAERTLNPRIGGGGSGSGGGGGSRGGGGARDNDGGEDDEEDGGDQ
jgi:hypothetical protein